MPGFLVEEAVFDDHYRVVKVVSGENIVYSIDVYKRLAQTPQGCGASLGLESSPARLCYVDLGGGCEAVVLETPGRVELVNLRLYASLDGDPAGGDPGRARDYCLGLARDAGLA